MEENVLLHVWHVTPLTGEAVLTDTVFRFLVGRAPPVAALVVVARGARPISGAVRCLADQRCGTYTDNSLL